ncbi:hypothetical protein BDV11DRAFT_177569 [Aspergillus similis]
MQFLRPLNRLHQSLRLERAPAHRQPHTPLITGSFFRNLSLMLLALLFLPVLSPKARAIVLISSTNSAMGMSVFVVTAVSLTSINPAALRDSWMISKAGGE